PTTATSHWISLSRGGASGKTSTSIQREVLPISISSPGQRGLIAPGLRSSWLDLRRVTADGEIVKQRRGAARDVGRDEVGGEVAEGDAVATIAVGCAQARRAIDRADQRQAVVRGIKGAGPSVIDACLGARPQNLQSLSEGARLGGGRRVSFLGLEQLSVVFSAEDDAAVPGGARIVIVLRGFPDQRALGPQIFGLRNGCNRPTRGSVLHARLDNSWHDITSG